MPALLIAQEATRVNIKDNKVCPSMIKELLPRAVFMDDPWTMTKLINVPLIPRCPSPVRGKPVSFRSRPAGSPQHP